MTYILDNPKEIERLEYQSTLSSYDFKDELSDISVKGGDRILDAGCGPGSVTRYLAGQHPQARVLGCDFSAERVKRASQNCSSLPNASFQVADLTRLPFENEAFDLAVCRYVIQHVPGESKKDALKEIARCLKPAGKLHLVDCDGTLLNLYPQTPFIAETLSKLEKECPIDLKVGRKLNSLLLESGLEPVHTRIQAICFEGEELEAEIRLTRERFEHADAFLQSLLKTPTQVKKFKDEFIAGMQAPGASYFYLKFIVTAVRASRAKLAVVR